MITWVVPSPVGVSDGSVLSLTWIPEDPWEEALAWTETPEACDVKVAPFATVDTDATTVWSIPAEGAIRAGIP